MKKIFDVILAHNKPKAEAFLEGLIGKKPLFVCTIGTTETAKIPGISAAGKYPELTDYTPPADVELLLLGRCKCIHGVPVTPEGIPTPALITMSALKLANIPALVVSGGLKINPHVPFFDLGGKPGGDIRRSKAVDNVEEIQFELADLYAKNEAIRTLCYKVPWMVDQREKGKMKPLEVAKWISYCKLMAPWHALECCETAMIWLGAWGYTKECPLEMGYRGIMSYCVGAEGATNIQRIVIGRELLGKEFVPYK